MRTITDVRITIEIRQNELLSGEDLASADFPREVKTRHHEYPTIQIHRSLSDDSWGQIPAELRVDLITQFIDALRDADKERRIDDELSKRH